MISFLLTYVHKYTGSESAGKDLVKGLYTEGYLTVGAWFFKVHTNGMTDNREPGDERKMASSSNPESLSVSVGQAASDATTSEPVQREQAQGLTHLDQDGAARMVDVGHKPATARKALAQAVISMAAETLVLLLDRQLPKGDALQVARIAGIMAAKQTPHLIPLCHPIPLSRAEIDFVPLDTCHLQVTADVRNMAQTGVEMEALTACAIAALTVYDMAKAVDPGMVIGQLCLLQKDGGKRGLWQRDDALPVPAGD